MRKSLIVIYILCTSGLFAQNTITLDSIIAITIQKHPQVLLAKKELSVQTALKLGSFNLSDPQILLESPTGEFFTPGIQQSIGNPLVYIHQSKVGKQQVALAKAGITVNETEVIRKVCRAYTQVQYAKKMSIHYLAMDSIFNALFIAAEKRYKAGDAGLLEKTSAKAKADETALLLKTSLKELANAKQSLSLASGIDTSVISVSKLTRPPDQDNILPILASSPTINLAQQSVVLAKQKLSLEKSKIAPGFSIGYMNQANKNSSTPHRFQFGLSIPFWFWTHSSRIKAANANVEKANYESELIIQNSNIEWIKAIGSYQNNLEAIQYYENTGLKQSEIILDAANHSYNAGEIGYIEYLFSLNQVFEIKASYYDKLKNYMFSIFEINYLNGNKL